MDPEPAVSLYWYGAPLGGICFFFSWCCGQSMKIKHMKCRKARKDPGHICFVCKVSKNPKTLI